MNRKKLIIIENVTASSKRGYIMKFLKIREKGRKGFSEKFYKAHGLPPLPIPNSYPRYPSFSKPLRKEYCLSSVPASRGR